MTRDRKNETNRPCSTRTLIWSFVLREVHRATLARRDLAGFYFPRDVAPARALRRTQHTRIGRHGGGSVLRQRYGRVRAPAARGFRSEPARNAVRRKPYSIRLSSSHRATASDHFPPPVHAQLPRCTWPRRPLSAWASASSPVPSGRYASRPAEPEPRRATAGPRHPAAPPPETEKYPQHGEERVSPLTFEPSSSRLTRLPAPPPAELALADQARRGGVLRQGQVSGLEGAFCALRKRQSVVGSVSRREDVVGNET